ncbi:MAG TPA: HAD family hydrolase [Thermoleophilia bacterium]|nr:HAD family hydrolase [Thermoleophilia bacterium]
MITAVTFDLWDTLMTDRDLVGRQALRATRLRETLAPFGVYPDDEELARAFARSWDNFDRIWNGEHRTPTTAESTDVVLGSLGVTVPAATRTAVTRLLEDLVLEVPPVPVEGAVEVVVELAAGYRLGLVSDTGLSPGRALREVLERLGLLRHFDFLYFSDEGGMSKPDPRVFSLVLEKLGARPCEAVHVGDIARTDIEGARRAGMRAIHFVGMNASDAEGSTADLVINRLVDLPAALEKLSGA